MMSVLGHFKTKFKDVVNRIAISGADHTLCDLLAKNSGLDFKASIEPCSYMGEPTDDIIFSYRSPDGLAEDISRCLGNQSGLRFEKNGDKVYIAIKNAWSGSPYCYGASFDDLQSGINKIDQEEINRIVIKATQETSEDRKLEVA